MENLIELQKEFAATKQEMVAIAKKAADEGRVKTEEETTKWNSLEEKAASLKERMETVKFLEENAENKGEVKEVKTAKVTPSMVKTFRSAINKAAKDLTRESFTAKADIVTTTDTGLINRDSVVGLETLKTPSKDFLNKLGVPIHTGLTANLPLPNMGQIDASILGEGAAAVEFSQAPATVTMTSQRIAKKKSFSVEFLAQSSDAVLQGIMEDMLDMPYRGAVEMLMDAVEVDALDASLAAGSGGYANVTKLPQNVPFAKKSPAFVSTYTVAGDMKGTARLTNQGPIWEGLYEDGVVDGYKAYAHSAVNTTSNLIFGDWSHAHVGVWAEPQILIDPLAERDNGKIKFIVEAQMDAAIGDYRAFKWYKDASIA